jgi:MFS transporter, YQGE family, putative transporter
MTIKSDKEDIMCKQAKILLGLSALFTFAMGLSSMFVSVFFWRQTSSFAVIVVYNLLHYATTPFTFILAGVLSKKKNGMWSLRIGLLLFSLFYASILLVGSKGLLYIYLLGILYGMAAGFYWLAYNTLCFDFTSVDNRDTYNGFNGSLCGIAAAVAPITSGYIISRFSGTSGYNIVFTATLSLFVVLVLLSLTLRCKNYGSRVNFKVAFSKNSEEWGNVRKATLIWGFRDVIIVFLINILIIETTNSEFSLGKFSLMASLLSSASFMLVQRVIKPKRRRFSIFLGAAFSFLSVMGLAFKVSYGALLFYTILDAFFIPFFIIQLSSSTFNVISRAHDEDLRIEYMINKDIMINGGRVISSIILLLLVTAFKDSVIIRAYLVFISLATLASGYYLSRLRGVLEGSK